jgi:hypothetical protein
LRVTKVVSFQKFSSTIITTAQAISSTLVDGQGISANAAIFSVGGSTGAIRFRDDGTAPVSDSGMRLPAGTVPYFYQGDLQRIKFIADSVPGNADVNATFVQVAD